MAVGELVTRKGFDLAGKIRAPKITIGSVSGNFAYGETVTGGTSGATGTVAYVAATELQLINVAGTFQNAETITGGTSAATATTSGTPSVSWTTAWLDIARVRDTFTVNRQRPVTEIVDFSTGEEDFTDKIAGNQSGNASFTINLVPGGKSFQMAEAAMDANLDMAVRRVQKDRTETNTRTRYYVGVVTGFNETDSVTDASTVAVTYEISDVSKTDPTT
ncbi:MAG TPA: hypothetical protein VFN07_01020 [Trueperaceae bacterium]|nr:hypothetical protein [Trueperaceae bacterium]